MENLVLLGERRRRVDLSSSSSSDVIPDDDSSLALADLCHVYVESEACTVVLTENGILAKVTEDGHVLWTCNLNKQFEVDGGWFNVNYVDPEIVCLSKRGAIVNVDPSTGEADLVGVFDQGLEAASWSPDGEILLMVTSTEDEEDEVDTNNQPQVNSRLMTMNAQFEVLAEVTIPKYIPSSDSPDFNISVTWRPDGTLCAVSSVDAEDNMRKIRIYRRETLDLHAIGRAEDASGTLVKGLQNTAISWASTGCSLLLSSVQRKGKKTQQVVFFEPNGLRHREFVLNEAPTTNVVALEWNITSDLLAVLLQEENGSSKVQLWHRSNYHWYQKHEIRASKVGKVKFNVENPYRLHVLLHGLEWREYEVRWEPSTTMSLEEKCTACVIDGCSLNLTYFDKAVIPPPMYSKAYSMESPINDISFCCDKPYAGSLVLTLSSGDLMFLSQKDGSETFTETKILWGDLKSFDPLSFRSLEIVGAEASRLQVVCIVCASFEKTFENLLEITIDDIDTTEPKAFVNNSFALDGQVLRMTRWLDCTGGCLIQLKDGSLFEYETTADSGSTLIPSEAEPLLEPCPSIVGIKDSSPYSEGDMHRTRLVFGLSSRSRLYCHDVMVTDSASSFMVSLAHEFLCFATAGSSRCQARFLPLKEVQDFDPLMGMDQNHVLEGYEPRTVEQGARIVAVLPHQPQMILQLPRGNLEGIHPRALVLRFVMTKISEGNYGEAFRMMRKHKVDLNLIVDLDPWGFIETGISSFVKEVDNIDYLNLFISNLQNYDVTTSRFPVPRWFPRNPNSNTEGTSFDFSTKVNQICSTARSVMLDMERTKEKPDRYYLLPVLSTFAKEDPPKLDEALKLIKEEALLHHPKNSTKNPLFAENAQHSIHYLAFLAEYELLFETALGMYDFDIARAVARNSQMDPKKYLPLLKRLNSLPTFYSRYEVDMRLKRFGLALKNLVQSNVNTENLNGDVAVSGSGNSFEDCLALINDHQLHGLGLQLFRDDLDKTRVILLSLGDHLMTQSRPKTALTVYLSANPPHFDGAKQAARKALDWKVYFSLVDSNPEGVEEEQEFRMEKRRQAAREIANEITSTAFTSSAKRQAYRDAALILVNYGDDLIGAIDYLIRAEDWHEGYRIATQHSRDDLAKKCVDGAVAFANTSIENFTDKILEFDKANKRYAEVLKLRKQNVYQDGPDEALLEEAETGSLFSVASTTSNMSLRSNASASSTGSGVSSVISVKTTNTFQMTGREETNRHRSKFNKGKKKKERKPKRKPRQKPGSEEELRELVGILKTTCPNTDYAEIISQTIHFLIFVQHLSLAEELFTAYLSCCDAISNSRSERLAIVVKERAEAEVLTRSEGEQHDLSHLLVDLPIEKEVDVIQCADLDTNLSDFFAFIVDGKIGS